MSLPGGIPICGAIVVLIADKKTTIFVKKFEKINKLTACETSVA